MLLVIGVSVNGKPAVSKTATGGSIPSTPAGKNLRLLSGIFSIKRGIERPD